jgi:hypothetical protein
MRRLAIHQLAAWGTVALALCSAWWLARAESEHNDALWPSAHAALVLRVDARAVGAAPVKSLGMQALASLQALAHRTTAASSANEAALASRDETLAWFATAADAPDVPR